MGAEIWAVFKSLLQIIAYFFNPDVKARAQRLEAWNKFQDLQKQYRQALAENKPQLAAQIAKEMQDLRDKYKFVGVLKTTTK